MEIIYSASFGAYALFGLGYTMVENPSLALKLTNAAFQVVQQVSWIPWPWVDGRICDTHHPLGINAWWWIFDSIAVLIDTFLSFTPDADKAASTMWVMFGAMDATFQGLMVDVKGQFNVLGDLSNIFLILPEVGEVLNLPLYGPLQEAAEILAKVIAFSGNFLGAAAAGYVVTTSGASARTWVVKTDTAPAG
jgi:hypothetical protein